MKKLLIGVLALTTVSAFAQEQKHMVQLSGYEDGRSADLNRTLDIYHSSGGTDKNSTSSFALNYAYAFMPALQGGARVAWWNQEGAGKAEDKASRYGIFAIWNFANRLTDTWYAGAGYDVFSRDQRTAAGSKSDADTMSFTAQGGYRFKIGTLWDMTYTWSPNIELGANRIDPDEGKTKNETVVSLNILKVDVLF